MMPTVALVGRPNVGKSTIFNRLVGEKISIVEDVPGVTRDRIYGDVFHNEHAFHLIDTGGIDVSKEVFNNEIIVQASIAIDEADVIVFIVDGKEELNQNDYKVRDMLKKSGKPVIIAVNKIDNPKRFDNIYDFYELGFEKIIAVSGEHNLGITTLLDEITSSFPASTKEAEYDEDVVKFCVIGRPNVGKSSLINALLNEERVIVSDVAGTTRDAIDSPFTYDKKKYVAIDTAGMRKTGRIYENIEKYSVIRSMKAISRSDVCVIVINAEEGIIEHDKHIAGYALESGKAMVIVVNKWDTVSDKNDIKSYTTLIRNEFKFLSYVPIVFLSAKTRKRIHTLMPAIDKVYQNATLEIKTSVLNDVVREAVALNAPPSYKGKRLKIYFCAQVANKPPRFNFQVNSKGLVHFSYLRYLENKLRESFELEGTPIVIQFKNKGEQ